MRFLIALWALLAAVSGAFAQAQTQQVASRQDATLGANTSNPGVGANATVTITPPAGQFVYITGVSLDACGDATGVAVTQGSLQATGLAVNGAVTATNIAQWSTALAINLCVLGAANAEVIGGYPYGTLLSEKYAIPLKSAQAGAAVTLATAASATHVAYTLRVYSYTGP